MCCFHLTLRYNITEKWFQHEGLVVKDGEAAKDKEDGGEKV